ncbi:hypothetical protein Pmani_014757 [Petrolisthes manimaculis]|uniref:Calponin-homology (CH) domain-containing protein n=1 Tax=Petrolisthes manimaculis TaxID=1843537 RepID=A0AAE1UAM8_9EUCA|nr:hypothetical protein Pmani_014757 [Petrolisthes manimaculis]
MAGKRDPQMEKEALEWIFQVVGEPVPNDEFGNILKDGQVLCRLMNKLSPGAIAKINSGSIQFKMMENINNFSSSARAYGVSIQDLFQTADLFEKKDLAVVCNMIHSLGRQTYVHPEWQGPYLGPRPAEENKREFTDEQLAASKTVIGLQAGNNKGASQAGMNEGAQRRVIIGK